MAADWRCDVAPDRTVIPRAPEAGSTQQPVRWGTRGARPPHGDMAGVRTSLLNGVTSTNDHSLHTAEVGGSSPSAPT